MNCKSTRVWISASRTASEAPADLRFHLFDLDQDPGEKRDISKQHPEVFARMKAELQKLLDDGRSRPTASK